MLNQKSFAEIQKALADANVDGWLIFDFHGLNPVAVGCSASKGMGTRRIFVIHSNEQASPVAITHAIEQAPWQNWPAEWKKLVYSGWRELETQLAGAGEGKNRRDGVFAR